MEHIRHWTSEEHKIAIEAYQSCKDIYSENSEICKEIQVALAGKGYKRTLSAIKAWKHKYVKHKE